MLVLTRKRNESIKIGQDIVIKVLHSKNGTVKLGIEAPANVRVLRAELTAFDEVPVMAAERHGNAIETSTVADPEATQEADCYFDFSSEYAAEMEDQMLCVASD